MADLNGLSYDRRDVTGRALANAYAQTLGAIFTEQSKPFEVEICVAQVGATPADDELYRLTYDGSVNDEPGRMAMGGQADAISGVLRAEHDPQMSLTDAIAVAVRALASVGGEAGAPREIAADQLEVAVLDRNRVGRTFRRITGDALTALLGGGAAAATAPRPAEAAEIRPEPVTPASGGQKPTGSAASADLEGAPAAEPPGNDTPATDRPESPVTNLRTPTGAARRCPYIRPRRSGASRPASDEHNGPRRSPRALLPVAVPQRLG